MTHGILLHTVCLFNAVALGFDTFCFIEAPSRTSAQCGNVRLKRMNRFCCELAKIKRSTLGIRRSNVNVRFGGLADTSFSSVDPFGQVGLLVELFCATGVIKPPLAIAS